MTIIRHPSPETLAELKARAPSTTGGVVVGIKTLHALLSGYEVCEAAQEWARALKVIHGKTFIGAGPHPEREQFQALEAKLAALAEAAP